MPDPMIPTLVLMELVSAIESEWSTLGDEPVTHPGLADQVPRMRCVGFDLLAQLSHQHPEMLGVIGGMNAPDGRQDHVVRQDAIGMSGEIREELEFLRCQPNLVM